MWGVNHCHYLLYRARNASLFFLSFDLHEITSVEFPTWDKPSRSFTTLVPCAPIRIRFWRTLNLAGFNEDIRVLTFLFNLIQESFLLYRCVVSIVLGYSCIYPCFVFWEDLGQPTIKPVFRDIHYRSARTSFFFFFQGF